MINGSIRQIITYFPNSVPPSKTSLSRNKTREYQVSNRINLNIATHSKFFRYPVSKIYSCDSLRSKKEVLYNSMDQYKQILIPHKRYKVYTIDYKFKKFIESEAEEINGEGYKSNTEFSKEAFYLITSVIFYILFIVN